MSWTGQSWTPEQPRVTADLTGNRCADIIGFGLDGVWAALGNGDGTFAPPNMVLCAFDHHTGWRIEKHPRVLADLTGDGCADIVGFGDAGVWIATAGTARTPPPVSSSPTSVTTTASGSRATSLRHRPDR